MSVVKRTYAVRWLIVVAGPAKNRDGVVPRLRRDAFRQDLGHRLSGLLDEFGTRGEAADVAGVVTDQLLRYIRGQVKPPFEVMARLAQAKNVSLDWLWTGEGPRKVITATDTESASLVRVPIYDVRAGMGFGQIAESEDVIGRLSFDPAWLASRGVRPKGAFLCFGIGDSMQPTIFDRDPLLGDLSDREPRDKVYLFRRNGALIIKRLQRQSDGTLVLISDNPAYRPEYLPRDEADKLEIIGRIAMAIRII